MKKEIASRLNKIADKMPHVFIEYKDTVKILGKELLLTPAAFNFPIIVPTHWYDIEIPKYVAVDHNKQVKDAYNRGGWKAVDLYSLEVLFEAGVLDGVDVLQMILDKNGIKEGKEADWVKPIYEQGGIKGIIKKIR